MVIHPNPGDAAAMPVYDPSIPPPPGHCIQYSCSDCPCPRSPCELAKWQFHYEECTTFKSIDDCRHKLKLHLEQVHHYNHATAVSVAKAAGLVASTVPDQDRIDWLRAHGEEPAAAGPASAASSTVPATPAPPLGTPWRPPVKSMPCVPPTRPLARAAVSEATTRGARRGADAAIAEQDRAAAVRQRRDNCRSTLQTVVTALETTRVVCNQLCDVFRSQSQIIDRACDQLEAAPGPQQ